MTMVYHAFKHILKVNDEPILVTERQWGERTLTGAQLEEFTADFDQIAQHEQQLIENGTWIVEDLPEQHNINGMVYSVPVGVKITMPNATGPEKPAFHEHYYKWGPIMLADPNITYIEPIWVE